MSVCLSHPKCRKRADVKPAEYFVQVTKREKRVCRFYRQSVIFLRDAGIDIGRATMCGWVMTVGEMLAPVVGAIWRELLAGSYIQSDETTVDVQMHDRRGKPGSPATGLRRWGGKNHQGYLWQYGTPGGATIFDFQNSVPRQPCAWSDAYGWSRNIIITVERRDEVLDFRYLRSHCIRIASRCNTRIITEMSDNIYSV